ncbi:MAG: methionine synthase [Anaerolineae bacterium]|nr:methionine synthase [Anaerolineae bacterium]
MAGLSFLERLKAGEILVADGATGTNLQARGLPTGTPTEAWLFDRPDEVVRLEREFVQAGADIILTNTFGGTAVKLQGHGWGERMAEVNRRAVELARQAVGDADVFVAGSIGPTGQLLKPMGSMEPEEAEAQFAAQARVLAEAGVDFLVIETQFDLGEATAAVKGVRSVCSLPLVVSFSYDRGTRTMMGVRPQKMAQEMSALDVDVLGINCGRSLDDNLSALQELAASARLPIWFKPNAGLPKLDEENRPIYDVTPEMMGAYTNTWIAEGARIVGGCCGTTPQHLQAIATVVKNR